MEDIAPPQELLYKWRIDQYGPPYDGGWMEWPAGLINRMNILATARRLMMIYREKDKSISRVRKDYGDGIAKSIIMLIKEFDGD